MGPDIGPLYYNRKAYIMNIKTYNKKKQARKASREKARKAAGLVITEEKKTQAALDFLRILNS